jgi:hypothetical protein
MIHVPWRRGLETTDAAQKSVLEVYMYIYLYIYIPWKEPVADRVCGHATCIAAHVAGSAGIGVMRRSCVN